MAKAESAEFDDDGSAKVIELGYQGERERELGLNE